jgi:hypothetical protein
LGSRELTTTNQHNASRDIHFGFVIGFANLPGRL